jgi:UDP-GlcNAc:undecaprenyl-phosphate GlcNAc-1-phosphate transferase
VLILPWVLALAVTPLVMRIATARDWLDHPDERKRHARPVPLLGGAALLVSCVAGVLLAAPWSEHVRAGMGGEASLGALALGALAMVALGTWDDLRDVPAIPKLAAQILIAVATWAAGFRCAAVELPFGFLTFDTPVFSFLVTVGWIVVVTNAFNLIDGVDGLAAGTSIVATLIISILAAENGASVPVIASLALAGALAGFLRYNLPPARIFLGDGGAYGIGYTTAVLSVASFQKAPTAVVLILPLLVLGFPLLDTILAVLWRTVDHLREHGLRGLHPGSIVRAVVRADRGHIHHLLLRAGWSVRSVLFALYAVSVGLGLVALRTRQASANLRWTLWLGLIAAGFVGLALVRRRAERLEREALPAEPVAVPLADAAASRRAS